MTEHLKKQFEDAASGVRVAKSKFRTANETIKAQEVVISNAQSDIATLEQSICDAHDTIIATVRAREASLEEFKLAEARLSFFNRELIDHPYAA